jgi:hypothetical protein
LAPWRLASAYSIVDGPGVFNRATFLYLETNPQPDCSSPSGEIRHWRRYVYVPQVQGIEAARDRGRLQYHIRIQEGYLTAGCRRAPRLQPPPNPRSRGGRSMKWPSLAAQPGTPAGRWQPRPPLRTCLPHDNVKRPSSWDPVRRADRSWTGKPAPFFHGIRSQVSPCSRTARQ